MLQPCHLHKNKCRKKEEQNFNFKYTKHRKKKNSRGTNLTVSHNRIILSLSKDNNPLSLCIDFGQSLDFLDNLLNVLGLQTKRTE